MNQSRAIRYFRLTENAHDYANGQGKRETTGHYCLFWSTLLLPTPSAISTLLAVDYTPFGCCLIFLCCVCVYVCRFTRRSTRSMSSWPWNRVRKVRLLRYRLPDRTNRNRRWCHSSRPRYFCDHLSRCCIFTTTMCINKDDNTKKISGRGKIHKHKQIVHGQC